MNDMQQLQVGLTKKFVDLETVLLPPLHGTGVWHLDLRYQDRMWVVQWPFEDNAWGLSPVNAMGGYGEGPEESYPDLAGVTTRIIALLTQKRITIDSVKLFERLQAAEIHTVPSAKIIPVNGMVHNSVIVLRHLGEKFTIYPYTGWSDDKMLAILIRTFDDCSNVKIGEYAIMIDDRILRKSTHE